jgi:hypothetical protein
MNHPLHRITAFEHLAPYTLRLRFDDGQGCIKLLRSIRQG